MIRVDNSRLKSVATCDTQAVIEFVLGYQGKEEPAARKCGKDLHSALAHFFRGGTVEESVGVFRDAYYQFAKDNVPENDKHSFANVYDILDEYLCQHPFDKFPFTPIPESVETPVTAKLADDIELWGLLDLQGVGKEVPGLYVIDHKSTGQNVSGGWWPRTFRLGSQMSAYIWLLQQIHPNEVVAGAYINAIQINKLPDVRFKNDGGEYKCKTHKTVISECRRQHAIFALYITMRSPELLQEWHRDQIALARRFGALQRTFNDIELIQYAPAQGRNNDACKFCQFRDFCAAGRRPELVESMLVHQPWEPWEK